MLWQVGSGYTGLSRGKRVPETKYRKATSIERSCEACFAPCLCSLTMAPATRRTDASSSAAAAHAEAAAASVPRQLTEAEKDELRAELWDEFRNDHYECKSLQRHLYSRGLIIYTAMEMLPLQLRRQSALLRELDEHASTELQRVQQLTRQYLELRTRLANGDIPESSEVNTRTLLAQIGAALNEYMRTAEEKVSIANNAYDSVDRHVRAMDGLIKEQDEVNNAGVRKVVFGYQQRPVTVTGHVEPGAPLFILITKYTAAELSSL